jgi:hypothetical protein
MYNRSVFTQALALATAALFCSAGVGARSASAASIHEQDLRRFGRVEPLAQEARPAPPARGTKAMPPLVKMVYGYYPYWLSGDEAIDYSLLSHVAWFAIELGSDGAATATHGWPGSWTSLVTAAHDAGVRVDVAFTLFSSSGIDTLVNSATYRTAAVDTIVAAIEGGDADGAAIDFEGVPSTASAGFATFLEDLRNGLDDAGLSDAQISVAGPAVDWSGAFDLAAILPSIDVYFIMGYDYFWSGSGNAGPTGILKTDAFWRALTGWSELRSMAEYGAQITEAERAKIVMGVPYYGREWLTTSGDLGAAATANVGSVSYAAAMTDLEDSSISLLWDEGALTAWYAFEDVDGFHEVYFDDAESLAWKYRFVNEQGLGGIGIWALGYDSPYTELWDEIEAAFTAPYVPHPGDKEAPFAVTDFPFVDARDSAELGAGGMYFNYYSCAPTLDEWGREFVYRVEICHDGAITATVGGDGTGVDNDVQILGALSEEACLARDNTAATIDVTPGTYFVVVDTYVADAVPQSGPFSLSITADGIPSPQCPDGQVCQAGECAEPPPDAGPDGGGPDAGDDGGTDADSDTDGDTDGIECTPWTKETSGCGCVSVGDGGPRISILSAIL